tara:strand:+ start:1110 stop:1934 length:825 start_codon:yes stop_codon:yes gene_type:complete
MPKHHNKKRNIGIIYEQIINFVSECLINENKKDAEVAINIIKNNFTKNSQLYKEYKLFKALADTHQVTDQLATMIITEAKSACNNMFDSNQLEKEKSNLIKELNYTFGKGTIFSKKISNYRIYATIQTLLNEWRENTNNFDKTTEYEILLHESLTEKSLKEEKKPIKVDKLTYSLMKEIFKKKYSSNLNEDQNKLISLYINEDYKSLSENYTLIKKRIKNFLENKIVSLNNQIILEKKDSVINKIKSLKENDFSKENLQKYLLALKLEEEILGE